MTTVADKMASKSWAATCYKDTFCSLHPPHQRSLISLSSTVQNLNRPDFLSKNSSGWKTGPVEAVGRIWCWRWQNSVMSEGFSAWGGQHWCLGREFLHNQGLASTRTPNISPGLMFDNQLVQQFFCQHLLCTHICHNLRNSFRNLWLFETFGFSLQLSSLLTWLPSGSGKGQSSPPASPQLSDNWPTHTQLC